VNPLRAFFWPDIHDEATARALARNGMVASFIIAILILMYILMNIAPWISVIEVVLFTTAGIGIRFMNKIAAAAGLALYAGEQFFALLTGRIGRNLLVLFIVAFFLLMFVNALRAIMAFEQMKGRAEATPQE
jgi:hypothetical protein